MLLYGCQIQVLGLPLMLGIAEMTLLNLSARRTLESWGNRLPCCFAVLFRGRESAGSFFFNSSALITPSATCRSEPGW